MKVAQNKVLFQISTIYGQCVGLETRESREPRRSWYDRANQGE